MFQTYIRHFLSDPQGRGECLSDIWSIAGPIGQIHKCRGGMDAKERPIHRVLTIILDGYTAFSFTYFGI
ncbi:hypothetical protein FM037_04040 [Shewanella psychropiezotolerans]|uniref:Globin-sensor domain-containing protein n=1 Tax=Shewanella psychropiezotolerans TaxID=2593655 RepID=A0ABX5WTZ7_9GAMM|nr:hypothetical protein [Shewanella psychropiezotolerans]QDO82559.1 hypothetical protein FM037_04040 [Shewanella psychropiezotolerans]